MNITGLMESVITSEKVIRKGCYHWFGHTRSSDAMKRGTVNEEAVLRTLRLQEYISVVYHVGLIRMKQSCGILHPPMQY